MKTNKFLYLLLLPLCYVFFSCSEEEADYTGAKKPTNDQVFFSNESESDFLLENGQNSVDVTLNRLKTDGELTVDLVCEFLTEEEAVKARIKGKVDEEDNQEAEKNPNFVFPKTVAFADGKDKTPITVSFDFDGLIPEKDYFVKIKVISDQTNEYGDIEKTISIKYAPWSEPKKLYGADEEDEDGKTVSYDFAEYDYYQMMSYKDKEQEVYYSENLLNPNESKFILTNWFYGVDFEITVDKSELVEINGKQCYKVTVSPQFTGYNHPNYGPVYVADSYCYWHDVRGLTDVTFDDVPSYYIPDEGRFVINVAYYVDAGYFGYGEEYLQFPGFEQLDYKVYLTYAGNFISPDDQEGVLIDFEFGEDLTSVKYAIFEGELNEEERMSASEDIKESRVAYQTTSEEGVKQFFLSETGKYTVIAVAYDEDNQPKDTSFLTFDFSPMKGWDNKWIGDFTYTQFFGDYDDETGETYPYVDEGLICQQNAEEAESFKILDWGFGTDFKFTFTDGGDVEVAYQPIGYEEEGLGPVYVVDLYAYTGSEEYAGKSSYDPATGTFTFIVYYPIVGTQYSYGYGAEYYEITDNAVKARVDAAYFAAKRKAPKAKKTNRFAQLGVNISDATPIYKNRLIKNLKLK